MDDELTTIKTVDHTQYGITMKLTNFANRTDMSSFLGSDNGYKNGNTESGLLSTDLAANGYPTTKAGNSLRSWFSSAPEVNHIFVESTFKASGYYEYDSVQNFAHRTRARMILYSIQILYTQNRKEHRLGNQLPDNPMYTDDHVFYKGTTTPVTFLESLTVGGVTYEDVFMLKPDEVAKINFPDGTTSYRIVECGVNTDVYSRVTANGETLAGTAGRGYPADRKDFGIANATTDERARVSYTNEVNPEALRTLSIRKKLYKEDGVTELTAADDGTGFNFRLYLGTEFNDEPEASAMHTYHVKDADGSYCRYDGSQQTFVSIGKTAYSDLTAEEKTAASFTTSLNGSITKVPAGYTVEVRNVLAGTRFGVVERPTEIPDGYSFQKYQYNGAGYSGNTTDAMTGVTDTVVSNADPHVDVCNLKGWGLRVNKEGSDADYMSEREAAYFAVYTGTSEDTLAMIPDTVRQMLYGEKTRYWYFPHLPVNVPFDQYEIREVTIENTNPSVGEEGEVSDPGAVTPIPEGGTVTLTGKQKGESGTSDFKYTVQYHKGTVEDDTNVRVDTVMNSRPGILIRKQDWNGNALAGAHFALRSSEGDVIGTFTSDKEGLITEAFLRENVTYTLTETSSPKGFRGLNAPVSIVYGGGSVTLTGKDEGYYLTEKEEDRNTVIIRNRPYSFKAVKKDTDSLQPMAGVKFALHKQHTVDSVTQISPVPLAGYEELVTDENGIIPKIDGTLSAGTYELREKETLEGYKPLSSYIRFTISETGVITLGTHPDGVSLTEDEETGENDELLYTLEVLNAQTKLVSFKKVDIADVDGSALEGAVFDLYIVRTEFGQDVRQTPALYTGLTSGADGMLYDHNMNKVFELPAGRYHLVETEAPESYHLKNEPVIIKVTSDGVIYDEGTTLSHNGRGKSFDETTGVYTLKISNNSGYILPSTGGAGTGLIYAAGMILILIAGVLYMTGIIRRRRK